MLGSGLTGSYIPGSGSESSVDITNSNTSAILTIAGKTQLPIYDQINNSGKAVLEFNGPTQLPAISNNTGVAEYSYLPTDIVPKISNDNKKAVLEVRGITQIIIADQINNSKAAVIQVENVPNRCEISSVNKKSIIEAIGNTQIPSTPYFRFKWN